MTDLSAFGGGVRYDPPIVNADRGVDTWVNGRERFAGYLGTSPNRDGRVFVTPRNSHRHRLCTLDAYGVNRDVLRTLRRHSVALVFVVENDTGDVFEWKAQSFFGGANVPSRFLDSPEDRQQYATCKSAVRQWLNHAGVLFEVDR